MYEVDEKNQVVTLRVFLARWELTQRYPTFSAEEPVLATDGMLSMIETYCQEEHRAESVDRKYKFP